MKRLLIVLSLSILWAGSGRAATWFQCSGDTFCGYGVSEYHGTVDLVSGQNSPVGGTNVWRFVHPQGMGGGEGVGNVWWPSLPGGAQEMWVQWWWKYDPGYVFDAVNNKQMYFNPANTMGMKIVTDKGAVMGPQGTNSDTYFPNVNTGLWYVNTGQWHKYKAYYKLNTGSQFNGIWRAWVDDVQIANYSNIYYESGSNVLTSQGMVVIWGRNNMSVPHEMYLYIAGLIVGDTDPGGGSVDSSPPYVDTFSPANGSTGVDNTTTSFSFHMKDFGNPSNGVDSTTISVNCPNYGGTKTCSAGLTCTGTSADYTVTYGGLSLSSDNTVSCTINGADLTSPPNVMQQQGYVFTTAVAPGGSIDYTDDFNRADASPLDGDWTTINNGGSWPEITSNQVNNNNGTWAARAFRPESFSSDQYSQIKYTYSGTIDDMGGPSVRGRLSSQNAFNGYSVTLVNSTTARIYAFTGDWGDGVQIGADCSGTFAQNDTYKLVAISDNLVFYDGGVEVCTRTDSSGYFPSGGAPGFGISGATATFDDWAGGNGTGPGTGTGGWVLSWSDEFDQGGCTAASPCEVDTTKWLYEVSHDTYNDQMHPTWDNIYYKRRADSEWGTTRTENVRVEDGTLVLEARDDNFEGRGKVSTGRLRTVGGYSDDPPWVEKLTYFRPARLEARMKIDDGAGVWAAMWTAGTGPDSWPQSGEIDIMEMNPWSYIPNVVFSNLHSGAGSYSPYQRFSHTGLDTTYHIWAMEWTDGKLEFFLDGTPLGTATPANLGQWPFDTYSQDLRLWMSWDEQYGASRAILPKRLTVDYVRLYTQGQSLVVITTTTIPNGQVGSPSSFTFSATGGTTPYTWSLVSGTLPPGKTLDPSGILTGEPTTAGTYNFTIRVTDALAATDDQVMAYTIHPATPGGSITIQISGVTDTYIGSGSPDNNFSTSAYNRQYTWPAATVANTTIMKIPMSQIPDNAVVSLAIVNQRLDSYDGSGGTNPMRSHSYRITGTLPTIETVTWNNFAGTLSEIDPVKEVYLVTQWYGWDVTNSIQNCYAEAASDCYIAFNSGSDSAIDSNRYFASMNHETSAYRPVVSVTYTPGGGGPPPPTISAPGKMRISKGNLTFH